MNFVYLESLFLPSFLVSLAVIFLVDCFLFFSHLSTSPQYLPDSIASYEKSDMILTVVPLFMSHVFLHDFKVFSLSLNFNILTMIFQGIDLYFCPI